MHNPIDPIPAAPSGFHPVISDSFEPNFYETNCGLCGAQIYFRNALTSWTKVYCPGCGEYVSVR
jgi:ribosomal protein S27E